MVIRIVDIFDANYLFFSKGRTCGTVVPHPICRSITILLMYARNGR
jgi:hypothetical protein